MPATECMSGSFDGSRGDFLAPVPVRACPSGACPSGADRLAGEANSRGVAIGFDHQPYEHFETGMRAPAKRSAGFRRIADQEVYLSRAVKQFVSDHIIAVVETRQRESHLAKLADRMSLTGGHHVIIRHFLLEHHPHGFDVIGGVAPIAAGFEVPKANLFGFSSDNGGHTRG